jgi:hypothetical protein
VLKRHPGYHLVVDLRGNLGGSSTPFMSLVDGIRADPAINRSGDVIGLVNQFTDSSEILDAHNLQTMRNTLLIGVPPMDPRAGPGDWQSFQLPHSGITIQYSTAVFGDSSTPWAIPNITLAPTLAQEPASDDPVLAEALKL